MTFSDWCLLLFPVIVPFQPAQHRSSTTSSCTRRAIFLLPRHWMTFHLAFSAEQPLRICHQPPRGSPTIQPPDGHARGKSPSPCTELTDQCSAEEVMACHFHDEVMTDTVASALVTLSCSGSLAAEAEAGARRRPA